MQTETHVADHRHVDWGAIIGGTVFAVAISLVLLAFGAAVGLSVVSPESNEGASAFWLAIATAIWFVWVAISSFGAGGYLAGRLSRKTLNANSNEAEMRDGFHGVLVWATGAIVGAMLAATGVSNTLGAISSGAGATVDAVSQAAGTAIEGGSSLLLENQGALPSAEASAEVGQVLARAAARGELTQDERDYLVRIAANASNLPEQEVNVRIDTAMQTVDEARQTAIETAEKARIASVIAAFVITATMLISGAAAYFAAVAGGRHRDENTYLFATRR